MPEIAAYTLQAQLYCVIIMEIVLSVSHLQSRSSFMRGAGFNPSHIVCITYEESRTIFY